MSERPLAPPTATLTVTIPNAASLSPTIPLTTGSPVAVQMPAAWTAAGLTFQASSDGVTFYDLYDHTGTEVAMAVDALRYIAFNKSFEWDAVRFLKIRSGTSALPVAQGAARTLTVVYIP